MKVAFVYDRVNKWGGAERVLLILKELFPDAPLFTSVYNKQTAAWAKKFTVYPSFLQQFPFAKSYHEWFPLLMPLAFESFSFDAYDLVISVTSEAAKGIITKPQTTHLCICLTPTRYLWSGYATYFSNTFFRFLSKPLVSYLRTWDKIAASRPDYLVAISHEVQKRIQMYYHRESTVVYPPLLLDTTSSGYLSQGTDDSGYFLVVSRLVSAKRIDIAIQACNMLQLPLKIIGVGSEMKYLQQIAGSTISFLGNLTDSDLVRYYKGCCALIFPGYEDFGLTVLEAQAFGKPVIAYKAGGALETIHEGKTGEFFSPQTADALAKKIVELLRNKKLTRERTEQSFYADACRMHASKFTKEHFKRQIQDIVQQVMNK